MPKSYKVCLVSKFSSENFTEKRVTVNPQHTFSGVPPPPSTVIWKSPDRISFKDFFSYDIEHEREEDVVGRIDSNVFTKIIRKGFIKAYFSDTLQLLLLSGKKADILDFCRKTKNFNYINIATIRIDMKELLEKLASIKLVWFRFRQGLIHASALMGANIQETADFLRYKDSGEISTLSFLFQMENMLHPVLVTTDGAIVLEQNYENVTDEVRIVLDIKEKLLGGIYKEVKIG